MVQFRTELQVGNYKINFGRIHRHLKGVVSAFELLLEKRTWGMKCEEEYEIFLYTVVIALICYMSDYLYNLLKNCAQTMNATS